VILDISFFRDLPTIRLKCLTVLLHDRTDWYVLFFLFVNVHRNIRADYILDLGFLICGGSRLSDLGFRHVAIDRNFLLPLRLHSLSPFPTLFSPFCCIPMPADTSTYADLCVLDNSV